MSNINKLVEVSLEGIFENQLMNQNVENVAQEFVNVVSKYVKDFDILFLTVSTNKTNSFDFQFGYSKDNQINKITMTQEMGKNIVPLANEVYDLYKIRKFNSFTLMIRKDGEFKINFDDSE